MSDWKSRAIKADISQSPSSDWKSRAVPAPQEDKIALGNPEAPGPDFSPKVSKEASQSATETIKDLARGLAQGATLGFSDEATAAAQAGKESLLDNADFLEKYKQYREEQRALNEAASQRSPIAYKVGEFAGGAAIPGLGEVSSVKSAIKTGALAGGLGGLGYSTSSEGADIAKDVGTGAAFGGALGGLVGAVGSKLSPENLTSFAEKKAAQAIDISPSEAAGMGLKQTKQLGRGALETFLNKPGMGTEELSSAAQQAKTSAGKTLGELYKKAATLGEDQGINSFSRQELVNKILADLTPEEAELAAPELAKITKIAPAKTIEQTLPSGEVIQAERPYTQEEARALQQKFADLGYSKKTGLTPESKMAFANAEREAKNLILEKLKASGPEGSDLASQIEAQDVLYRPAAVASRNLAEKLGKEAVQTSTIPTRVRDLLSSISPEKSTQAYYANKAASLLEKEKMPELYTPSTSVGAKITTGGAAALEGSKDQFNTDYGAKKVPNDFHSLNQASPEQIKDVSQTLKSKGVAGEYYGSQLEQSLDGSDIDKAATMFQLNQQPGFRKLLKS